MSISQISILSRDDLDQVHENTLYILEETGIKVLSGKALDMLEHGGASVDRDIMTAYITEHMVNEAVKTMPKEITLSSRDPAKDLKAPVRGPPFMATNGTAVYMRDLETGEKRATTGKDLKDFTVLSDAVDALDYIWPIVTAQDGPEKAHGLNDLVICLRNSTKHFQGEGMSEKEAEDMVRVASAVVGGEDELAKRPIFSTVQCPICPLEFEKGSVEATMVFARAGIPVVSMSMALCGLTAPVTLAAAIAIVNSENLASFVISQLAKPGAPVIYSSESSIMNMRTGEIKYGSIEEVIIAAAVGQMAKSYGAPAMVGSFGLGLHGDEPGISATAAEMAMAATTNLSLTDFSSGIGGLDQAKGSALEQIIIDADVWEAMKGIRKEVVFDDDHFALDLIEKVGPGGNFLREPHTVKNLRKELFVPDSEKAELYDSYSFTSGNKAIVEQARNRVRTILQEHKPEPLDSDVDREIDKIMAEYAR